MEPTESMGSLAPVLQSLLIVAALTLAAIAGATGTYARLARNQHVWFKLANLALYVQAVLVGRAALDLNTSSVIPVAVSLICYLVLREKSSRASAKLDSHRLL